MLGRDAGTGACLHRRPRPRLWAISAAADLEIEPRVDPSGRLPDAASTTLFASGPAVIEIRALSDDTFSGKEAMERTANKLVQLANSVRRDAGRKLRFEFLERSFCRDHRFHRERCVVEDFEVTPYFEDALRQWMPGLPEPQPAKIRLTEGGTDILVTWHLGGVHPRARARMSDPAWQERYHRRAGVEGTLSRACAPSGCGGAAASGWRRPGFSRSASPSG